MQVKYSQDYFSIPDNIDSSKWMVMRFSRKADAEIIVTQQVFSKKSKFLQISGHHTYLLPLPGFRPDPLGYSNRPTAFSIRVKNLSVL